MDLHGPEISRICSSSEISRFWCKGTRIRSKFSRICLFRGTTLRFTYRTWAASRRAVDVPYQKADSQPPRNISALGSRDCNEVSSVKTFRSFAVPCGPVRSRAVRCGRVRSRAVVCGRVRSRAVENRSYSYFVTKLQWLHHKVCLTASHHPPRPPENNTYSIDRRNQSARRNLAQLTSE